MNNILITSVGRRVSLVNAFQNEIKKYFSNSQVLTADANQKLSAASNLHFKSTKLPKITDSTYLKSLINFCKKNQIKLIVPTIDTELLFLAKNKEQLLKHNIRPIISSINFIKKCRDKRLIHSFFKDQKIRVAKEYNLKNFQLPLFVKPRDGSRSKDNHIVKSKKYLNAIYSKEKGFMLLEYFDSKKFQEFTCDLYYGRDSSLKCVVPRKRIDIRDGEVNKAKTEKNFLVEFIVEKLSYINGARGCLTAQFFKHKNNDEVIGIEINPRFGGGFPLTYASGANFPKWIIEEYLLDKNLNYFDNWEKDLLMLRYDKEIFINNSYE